MRKKGTVRALMTAATLLLGGALCWNVIDLCRSGLVRRAETGPAAPVFTWEQTALRAWYMLPALALWLAAALIFREKAPKAHASGIIPGRQRTPLCPGWLRLLLYVFAAALIALGAVNGGMRDVLVKAINICTECIGLG